MMLSLDDIKGAKTKEAVVHIDGWGGEVRIRQLTVAESSEVAALQGRGEHAAALVRLASFALVEPRMSVRDINALPADAFEAIREIADAVGEIEGPKS